MAVETIPTFREIQKFIAVYTRALCVCSVGGVQSATETIFFCSQPST